MKKTRLMIVTTLFALMMSFATLSALAQGGTPAPGLYVTDLKISPPPPYMGNQLTFTPSFQNSTDKLLTSKWRVLIYRAAKPDKSYGDTTWTTTEFARGASDQLSLGDWHASRDIICDWYFVRVVWQDQDNNQVPFTTPDGQVFEKGFNTCEPLSPSTTVGSAPLPVAPPVTAPASATSAPGLYVSDLKISPPPPYMGNQLTFTPTFQNSTDKLLTSKWRVLIYRAAKPDKSYGDTTWTTTEFARGASDQLSLGDWHASRDITCDWYFVRVVWQDQDYNQVPFTTADGQVFEKGFNTCP